MFKKIAMVYSCIYSAITIFSSILNMILGETTDTYFHLLDRAVVVFIPVFFFFLIKDSNFKFTQKVIIHYIATLVLTVVETFIIGMFSNLASTAYRDQIINYTVVYIIIICFVIIRKNKGNWGKRDGRLKENEKKLF